MENTWREVTFYDFLEVSIASHDSLLARTYFVQFILMISALYNSEWHFILPVLYNNQGFRCVFPDEFYVTCDFDQVMPSSTFAIYQAVEYLQADFGIYFSGILDDHSLIFLFTGILLYTGHTMPTSRILLAPTMSLILYCEVQSDLTGATTYYTFFSDAVCCYLSP